MKLKMKTIHTISFHLSLLVIYAQSISIPKDPVEKSSSWVVLVAGSNGYDDYDFEADVCHAYHMVRDHGIPEDHIITIMYDDVAYSESNPTPGVIINWPNGTNVYDGCKVDYRKDEVTVENFMKVLTGDKELESQGKKVLKSSSSDNVFLFMTDHGAPGIFVFPNEELSETQLRSTLTKMHQAESFGQMLIYHATCYSGSMYEHLKAHMNILAITAARSTELDYRCYYDKDRQVYLTDYFGSFWMRDIDSNPSLKRRTISDQLNLLEKEMSEVPKSQRSEIGVYGDTSLLKKSLSEFLGGKTSHTSFDSKRPKCINETDRSRTDEVPLKIMERRIAQETNNTIRERFREQYNDIIEGRAFIRERIRHLSDELKKTLRLDEDLLRIDRKLTENDCYENLFIVFKENCFDIQKHPFARYQLHPLVNVCEEITDDDDFLELQEKAQHVIRNFCISHVRGHTYKRIV